MRVIRTLVIRIFFSVSCCWDTSKSQSSARYHSTRMDAGQARLLVDIAQRRTNFSIWVLHRIILIILVGILRIHVWLIWNIRLKSLIRLLIGYLIIIRLLLCLILILKLSYLKLITLLLNSKINGLYILISFSFRKLRNSLIIQRVLVLKEAIRILACKLFFNYPIFWILSDIFLILCLKMDSFRNFFKVIFLITVRINIWCFRISCVLCGLFLDGLNELAFGIWFYIGTPDALSKTEWFIFFIL